MKTKKLVYVYEIRHTIGTCVYEITWDGLVELAKEKCLDVSDDIYNDDELIVEKYLSLDNKAFGVFNSSNELANHVAWYYHHGLHKAFTLRRAYLEFFENDSWMKELLQEAENQIIERNKS